MQTQQNNNLVANWKFILHVEAYSVYWSNKNLAMMYYFCLVMVT